MLVLIFVFAIDFPQNPPKFKILLMKSWKEGFERGFRSDAQNMQKFNRFSEMKFNGTYLRERMLFVGK